MSRYEKQPIDFAGLKTVSLADRGGKVKIADFATPYRRGTGVAGLIASLPRILAADAFRSVVDAIAASRDRHRAIIWGLGGHVIKCGLAPVLVDLTRRGYATGAKIWPQVDLLMQCEEIDVDDYFKRETNPERTLQALVGDLHRMIVYPRLGFQIEQPVPSAVVDAFKRLIAAGYDWRLLAGYGAG